MPFFYQYEKEITEKLREMGAEVYLIDANVHARSLWDKLICFYTKKLKKILLRAYYDKACRDIPADLDLVVVIKGPFLDKALIGHLRQRFPQAVFADYQWDSTGVFPEQLALAEAFDRVLTFDPVDAAQYGWQYCPTYYRPEETDPDGKPQYDLVFICSMHTRRLEILRQLKALARKKDLKLLSYIYVPRLQYFLEARIRRNPLYRRFGSDMHTVSLPPAEICRLYRQSRCIVDYTFAAQQGYSMRTLDSLHHRCKLLTNNAYVRNADFYRPENIFVYDEKRLVLPEQFLETPYAPLPEEILRKYSLEGFLQRLFAEQCR